MSAPSSGGMYEIPSSDGAVRRTRRRPGENRERLLEAGIAAFGSHGYHGTSTAAIAAIAGVPQPHVYANFQTKQELFLECARRVAALTISSSISSHTDSTIAPDHAAFLLQSFAAFREELLQPELKEVILDLRSVVGTDVLSDLILANIRSTLSDN